MSWPSVFGAEYFILVTGFAGETGNFVLHVDGDPAGLLSYSDGCFSANPLSVDSIPVLGSTIGEPVYAGLPCGGAEATDSAGAWFRVVGTGTEITVDTCDENSNFDTTVRSSISCITPLPFLLNTNFFFCWNHFWFCLAFCVGTS